MFLTSLKQTCNEYLIKFSENQSAPKLENRKTSPCSPCAPNLPHVLLSRIPGYHNLCSPAYLDDESLHTLGEFIFNVITQRVKLDNNQLKKVKKILEKDKHFYKKLVDVNTDDPMGYFRNTLKSNPQVGQGIVSLIAALAPLISSLILR